MEWFHNWINQIILAVIICTLIELILPENARKKYVKAVIGIYMLACTFTPIAELIGKRAWEKIDFSSILGEEAVQTTSMTSSNIVYDVYEQKLAEDLKQKLDKLDYEANKIEVKVKKKDDYEIEKIILQETKSKSELIKGYGVSDNGKNEICQMIKQEYEVTKDKIEFVD